MTDDDRLTGMPLEGRPVVRGGEWQVKITDLSHDPERDAWTVRCRARADELDPWVLTLTYDLHDRGLQLSELNLAHPGADQLSMDLLRRLGLTALGKVVNDALNQAMPEGMDVTQWRLQVPLGGRRRHPMSFYARWVEMYLAAIDKHGSKYFLPHLLEDNPGYTRTGIAQIIARAETYGMITDRPGRGAGGGTMTEKCRQTLGLDW